MHTRDAVLTYIRLEGLNERNDRFFTFMADEAVIAAARCVAGGRLLPRVQDGGESVSLPHRRKRVRPYPSRSQGYPGQLHRQPARSSRGTGNRGLTCAPRARITMTYGFSRLCDEDGKSRSISAWKAEADAYLKRNETRLGGDTE